MTQVMEQNEPEGGNERRKNERHALVLRVAKLVCDEAEYPCLIKDVSANGFRVKAFGDVPDGTDYELVLANGLTLRCDKRWVRGDHAGFQFEEAVALESLLKIDFGVLRKRAIRINTRRDVAIKRPNSKALDNKFAASVINISQTGFCLETPESFLTEEEVEIRFGLTGVFLARHIWCKGRLHGFRFAGVLPVETFARLCIPDGRSLTEPVRPEMLVRRPLQRWIPGEDSKNIGKSFQ